MPSRAPSVRRLNAGDAVAAILVAEGRYLLQLRDDDPDIYYPAHWGLFGGGIDPGETAERALYRELREELGFEPREFRRFTNFDFDFAFSGHGVIYRTYYEIPIRFADLPGMPLGEGSDLRFFTTEDLAGDMKVVPYDAFALWLHANHHRIAPPP